jgi:replication factor C subunit 3/5
MEFYDSKPNLDELDFHKERFASLKNITVHDMPHLLFYGPATSGKSTVIYAFLASLMDKKVYEMKTHPIEEDKKCIFYRSSIYHIEFNCYEIASHEKMFIQSFLKEYIQTKNIGLDIPKIVYIKNAHYLSKQSQLSFRRMIEMNSLTCRFIFEISSYSSMYDSITSRCLALRVPLPSQALVHSCLTTLSQTYNHSIPSSEIDFITEKYKKDLKKMFGVYFYYVHSQERFLFHFHEKLNSMYLILTEQKMTPFHMEKTREYIYDMYILLVPLHECMMYLFDKVYSLGISKKSMDTIRQQMLELAVKTDQNLKKGNKDFFHLEYFFISLYNILSNFPSLKKQKQIL